MAFHIEDIKSFIREYFQNNNSGLIKLKSQKVSDFNHINRDLFELEVLIQEIKKEEGIKLNLNPTISSIGIIKSMEFVNVDNYFKSVDYQFNFFSHLAYNYNIKYELHEYINSFVKEFKGQLAYTDIKITDSGATRIFTNLRFAINDLRNLGLVLRQNENGKRILLPSVFGLLVLIYIQNNRNIFSKRAIYKPFDDLKINQNHGYYPTGYEFDFILSNAIKDLNKVDIIDVISPFSPQDLTDENKNTLSQILKTYTEYVLDILEITNEGIKTKKGFEEKTKQFIANAENENLIPGIHTKLLKFLKALMDNVNKK